jgi:hypothetical protein
MSGCNELRFRECINQARQHGSLETRMQVVFWLIKYNNEGKAGNPHGFFSFAYGAGPLRFFEILEEWREAGDLSGYTIS